MKGVGANLSVRPKYFSNKIGQTFTLLNRLRRLAKREFNRARVCPYNITYLFLMFVGAGPCACPLFVYAFKGRRLGRAAFHAIAKSEGGGETQH